MLFAWANKQLEKLSETIAPVSGSSSSSHRFLSCLATGDENTALTYLRNGSVDGEALEPHTVLNPGKGSQPIHMACHYGSEQILRALVTEFGVRVDTFDYQGNTALHYASMRNVSGAVHLVKILVSEFHASVTLKNMEGQTPYDVSTDTLIRQYLLPLQLQQETQACLDAGGQGLPPGIDLGGLRINRPPPPTMPPTAMGQQPQQQFAPPIAMASSPAGQQQPPQQFAPPGMPPSASGQQPPQQQYAPPPTNINNAPHAAPPTDNTAAPPQTSFPPPPMLSDTPPPNSAPPPNNFPPPNAPNRQAPRRIPSDGFHTSASDATLQKKYGHVAVPPPMYRTAHSCDNLPPPPSFSSVPSSGGAPTRSKYLAYDARTDTATAVFSGGSAPSSGGVPPPPMNSFNVFNPAAASAGASPAGAAPTANNTAFPPLAPTANNTAFPPPPKPAHEQHSF